LLVDLWVAEAECVIGLLLMPAAAAAAAGGGVVVVAVVVVVVVVSPAPPPVPVLVPAAVALAAAWETPSDHADVAVVFLSHSSPVSLPLPSPLQLLPELPTSRPVVAPRL
jgi:hypothetical protein